MSDNKYTLTIRAAPLLARVSRRVSVSNEER